MVLADVARAVSDTARTVLATSSDRDEVVGACTRALRPHRLRVHGRSARLAAELHHLPVGPVSVNRLRYGADVTVEPALPDEDNFLVSVPVAGRARFRYGARTAELSPRHAAVVGPYREFSFAISAEFDQLVLRLDRRRVEILAGRLQATSPTGPVELPMRLRTPPEFLVRLVESALTLPSLGPGEGRALLAAQLGDLIIQTVLLGQLDIAGDEAGPTASPRTRRATDFMHDRLAEPISLADVATHCGISVRSLHVLFRRDLDTTPAQWLRRQRLDRARLLLAAATPGDTTVTDVALRCGFVHLGEFAARFRERFGATPSQVLAGPPG